MGLTIQNIFQSKVLKIKKKTTIQDLYTYKNYNIYSISKQHITYSPRK